MSVIKLKNVSKFYYQKGNISTGFSRVNLSFDMGEFVVIVGESGSGKSTLLNVISGLDSYEEGEMYINDEETSHYTEKDFENYRRKYVGNIFQNFNLVNSYTVYQNIELVLLLNGYKRKEVKKKVLGLIKQVGLYKFRNTKASKLSGGQKQRVAIARALAKNTPMIIADEPTGNLDSKSSTEIMKLLSEISKEKLVIIVTHNFEDVKEYATRVIKMHDGKVLEDKHITENEKPNSDTNFEYKDITFLNKLRLSFRNTFNIIPKFLLLFAVYLFIVVAIITEYASFKAQEYETSVNGYSWAFTNIDDKRIVIKKTDGSYISDNDYNILNNLDNVDYIIKNDLFEDTIFSLNYDDTIYLDCHAKSINEMDRENLVGRMPVTSNEIVIEGSKDYYYLSDTEILLNKTFNLSDNNDDGLGTEKVTVVGIIYNDDLSYNYNIYVSDTLMNSLSLITNISYSDVKYLFEGKYYEQDFYTIVIPNSKVPIGKVYINSDMNYLCPKENCLNGTITVQSSNLYYDKKIDLTISKTYEQKSIKSLLGISDYDVSLNPYAIFINEEDYNKLFDTNNYQSSIFVKNTKKIDDTVKELEDLGYKTLAIKDAIVAEDGLGILRITRTIVTLILVIVLFFISYFVIKIILKSRNVYFSTIRILGSTKEVSRKLLIYELFIVSNIAYFSFIIFTYFSNKYNLDLINDTLSYLSIKDYLILYIIIALMSYLISNRYARKLFKDSAISTLREEI